MDGYRNMGIPVGFGMALSANEKAMVSYSKLTEAEKEKIIMKCKDARSKEEMENIVDNLVPQDDVGLLFNEPEMK